MLPNALAPTSGRETRNKIASEDQFERALAKADADRLVRDAQVEKRSGELRKIVELWAESIVYRLNPLLDDADFGRGTTRHSLDFDDDTRATLTYERSHKMLRLIITTSAQLIDDGLILVGEDHREVENTARMTATLERSDTKETRTAEYRYSILPASKVTAINQERFAAFLRALVAQFGPD